MDGDAVALGHRLVDGEADVMTIDAQLRQIIEGRPPVALVRR